MKETELAQKFIDYLSCYDLYFEVDYYNCVDIVGIAEKTSIAVEVKTSFNFKVLEQAIKNKPYFNYSYVAVPDFKDWFFQIGLCKDYGIGLLCYNEHMRNGQYINEIVCPKLNRHANNKKLISRLHEYNKRSLAGSKSGDGTKITAFGVTVENLKEYIQRHDGCTIKEAISGINHHYRNDKAAVSNMYRWITDGVIKGIELKDKKLHIEKVF